MLGGGIVALIAGAVLVIIGISFIFDIKTTARGPGLAGASVDSLRPRRTYTFFRVESEGLAWFLTVLTFILAAGGLVTGVVLIILSQQ